MKIALTVRDATNSIPVLDLTVASLGAKASKAVRAAILFIGAL